MTTNPLTLMALILVAAFVVAMRRSEQAWARSFRLYLLLGLVIVVIRVVFRIVFGSVDYGQVILDLPEISLPDWVAGIRLLGPVTRESLLAGLYDGLRLAAIVISVGAANSLANPKRLLKSVPAALYEIGTSLVVAVTVLPQLGESLQRVRAAQSLRGGPAVVKGRKEGRVRGLRRLVIPVLEDALERSIALAAGMDARGYGRQPGLTARERAITGGLLLLGLLGVCVGTYAVLDQTAPRILAGPMLAASAVLAVAGMWSAGRRVGRTRYRPDPWAVPEGVVVACGIVVAAVSWWVAREQIALAYPAVTGPPSVSAVALGAVLVGAVPAFAAPMPRSPLAAAAARPDVQHEVPA